jgi:hypothetical protein
LFADAFSVLLSAGILLWLIIGLSVSYVVALPIALVANAAFRRLGWRKVWQYAAAGAAIGLGLSVLFLYLLGGWDSVALSAPTLVPAGAIAGASAAAVFWWMAVRVPASAYWRSL